MKRSFVKLLKKALLVVTLASVLLSFSSCTDPLMDNFIDTLAFERVEDDVVLFYEGFHQVSWYKQGSREIHLFTDPDNAVHFMARWPYAIMGDCLYFLDSFYEGDGWYSYEGVAFDMLKNTVVQRVEMGMFYQLLGEYERAYYNGCLYMKDSERSVKYDILNGVVADVEAEEEERAYQGEYDFETLPEKEDSCSNLNVRITNRATGEAREITVEKIAETSEAMQALIERYTHKHRPFACREVFESVRYPLYEIDGEIYLVCLLNGYGDSFTPIMFHYDWETDTFSYCAGANSDWDYVFTEPMPYLPME